MSAPCASIQRKKPLRAAARTLLKLRVMTRMSSGYLCGHAGNSLPHVSTMTVTGPRVEAYRAERYVRSVLQIFLCCMFSMWPSLGFATTAPVSYRALVLADRPLAYYRLDETSGTVAHDASGHHFDGAIGTHVKLGRPGVIADAPTSMEFSGADRSDATEDVRVVGNRHFQLLRSLSIEAWAFPYSVGVRGDNSGDITIAAYGRDDAADGRHCRYALELDARSHVWHFPMVINGTVTEPIHVTGVHSFVSWIGSPLVRDELRAHELYAANRSDGNPPQANRLYHLVGTYDGQIMRFYINGRLNNVLHVRGAIRGYGSHDGLGIGGEFVDRNAVFRGRISEVAVYDHVLTPDQIRRHYEQGIRPENPHRAG